MFKLMMCLEKIKDSGGDHSSSQAIYLMGKGACVFSLTFHDLLL